MLDRTSQKVSIFENIKYRFSVQGEPGLEVWASLEEIIDKHGACAGWEISTTGRVRKSPDDTGSPFRSVQRLNAQRKLTYYSFEEISRWNCVDRKGASYVFSDGRHDISSIELPEMDFLLESNNFGALAALFVVHGLKPGMDAAFTVLPQGSYDSLDLPFSFDEDGKTHFSGITLQLDADGMLIGNIDGPGQLVIERIGHESIPPDLLEDIFRGHTDHMNFYPVQYRNEEIPSSPGSVFATFAEGKSKSAAHNEVAVMLGGTGRYNRDGQTLAGVNVGYGRLMDALAFYGLPSLRFDRRASLGAREVFTHADVTKQASDVLDFCKNSLKRDSILLGHSYGGFVGASLARKANGVKALVLISTPAKSLMETIRWQRQQAMDKITNPEMLERYRQTAADFDRKLDPSFDEDQLSNTERNTIMFIRSIGDRVLGDLLAEVDVPVLILQGTLDEQVPPDDAYTIKDQLEARNKPVSLTLLDNFGHMLNPPDTDGAPEKAAPKFDREIYARIRSFLDDYAARVVH